MEFSVCIMNEKTDDVLRVVKDKRFEIPIDKIDAVNDHMCKYVDMKVTKYYKNLNFSNRLKAAFKSIVWLYETELIQIVDYDNVLIESPLLNNLAKFCVEFGCISIMYEVICHLYKVCHCELDSWDFDKEILVSTLSRNNTVKFILTGIMHDEDFD